MWGFTRGFPKVSFHGNSAVQVPSALLEISAGLWSIRAQISCRSDSVWAGYLQVMAFGLLKGEMINNLGKTICEIWSCPGIVRVMAISEARWPNI